MPRRGVEVRVELAVALCVGDQFGEHAQPAALADHDLVVDVTRWAVELGEELADDEWLVRFLEAVGTDPAVIPPEAREEVVAMVPLVRRSDPLWAGR